MRLFDVSRDSNKKKDNLKINKKNFKKTILAFMKEQYEI